MSEQFAARRRPRDHVHEFTGSVRIAEATEDPHNHRFAGVTGPAILYGGSHYHRLDTGTDFYEGHLHTVTDSTGGAQEVGGDRHVHFVEGQTSSDDGHRHRYRFATLIDDPIGD